MFLNPVEVPTSVPTDISGENSSVPCQIVNNSHKLVCLGEEEGPILNVIVKGKGNNNYRLQVQIQITLILYH